MSDPRLCSECREFGLDFAIQLVFPSVHRLPGRMPAVIAQGISTVPYCPSKPYLLPSGGMHTPFKMNIKKKIRVYTTK